MVAQQTIVRRSNRKVTAQQVEPLAGAGAFADHKSKVLVIARRLWPRAASVMHYVRLVSWQQQDVAGLQLHWPAASRILQHRRSGDHRVIGDFVRLAGPLIDAPRRAIEAAQIEPAAHRYHLEQSAEPIHCGNTEDNLRRLSI